MKENKKSEFDDRIGKTMQAAVYFVKSNGGVVQSKHVIAKAVGPNGSTQYGYPPVNRCIFRGLLRIDEEHNKAEPRGIGAVILTDKGRKFLKYRTSISSIDCVKPEQAEKLTRAGFHSVESVRASSKVYIANESGLNRNLISRVKSEAEEIGGGTVC